MKDITTLLCSEENPTVSIILPLFSDLVNRSLNSSSAEELTDAEKTIEQVKKGIKKDLEGRYGDKKPFLKMAAALDPRFKQLPFLSEDERDEVYAEMAKKATSLPDKAGKEPQKRAREEDEEITPAKRIRGEEGSVTPPSCLENLLGDVYIAQHETVKSKLELVQEDIATYRRQPSIPLTGKPLEWLSSHEESWPRLA
jgi:hypothetical protein